MNIDTLSHSSVSQKGSENAGGKWQRVGARGVAWYQDEGKYNFCVCVI